MGEAQGYMTNCISSNIRRHTQARADLERSPPALARPAHVGDRPPRSEQLGMLCGLILLYLVLYLKVVPPLVPVVLVGLAGPDADNRRDGRAEAVARHVLVLGHRLDDPGPIVARAAIRPRW